MHGLAIDNGNDRLAIEPRQKMELVRGQIRLLANIAGDPISVTPAGHSLEPKRRVRFAETEVIPMAVELHQLGPRTYNKSATLNTFIFERLSTRPLYANHNGMKMHKDIISRALNHLNFP